MIRDFRVNDLQQVMDLWLETNVSAHCFIPSSYWYDNFDAVKSMIPDAQVYIYEADGTIQGFVGLVENNIAGIFVSRNNQSKGIGKRLLDSMKKQYQNLSLQVYKKNERAVCFYLREGFVITSVQIDENTGENEYTMSWRK